MTIFVLPLGYELITKFDLYVVLMPLPNICFPGPSGESV